MAPMNKKIVKRLEGKTLGSYRTKDSQILVRIKEVKTTATIRIPDLRIPKDNLTPKDNIKRLSRTIAPQDLVVILNKKKVKRLDIKTPTPSRSKKTSLDPVERENPPKEREGLPRSCRSLRTPWDSYVWCWGPGPTVPKVPWTLYPKPQDPKVPMLRTQAKDPMLQPQDLGPLQCLRIYRSLNQCPRIYIPRQLVSIVKEPQILLLI